MVTAFASALFIATVALLFAAWLLRERIHIGEDFVLARRRFSAVFTGLSQAVNCLPAWLLLMLSLFAYSMGLAAVWMALAMLVGLTINWWWIAPQLRTHVVATGSYTLSQWFAASAGDDLQAITRRSATAIVVFCLGFATLTLLQWAAQSLAMTLGITMTMAIVALIAVLLLTIVSAGLWSASAADLLQVGVLSLALPIIAGCALFAVGGWHSLWSAIATRESVVGPWFGGYSGVLVIALLVGVLFAGLASAAQPQVIARYLACRDDVTLARARPIAMVWSVFVLVAALLIGWCARALLSNADHHLDQGRAMLSELIKQTMPGWLSGVMGACVIIAFALTCASPWVAVATHLAIDLRSAKKPLSLAWCRVTASVFGLFVGCAALYFSTGGEERLWLCWHGLSAAFGPLLFVRLTGKKVRPGSSLGAMWSGFVLTVLFHLMPDTPGDLLERSLPFIAAMGIALSGGDQRRNPNRADRGDKTVHDHLSI